MEDRVYVGIYEALKAIAGSVSICIHSADDKEEEDTVLRLWRLGGEITTAYAVATPSGYTPLHRIVFGEWPQEIEFSVFGKVCNTSKPAIERLEYLSRILEGAERESETHARATT